MLKIFYLVIFSLSLNLFSEINISSPDIYINNQNIRVVEFKTNSNDIEIDDVRFYEYKSDGFYNQNNFEYWIIENYVDYQIIKIALSNDYLEDYISFKIQIKNIFEKDIFIFLPSKIRKTNLKSQNILKNENKVSGIKSLDAQQYINKDLSTQIDQEIYEAENISTVWSVASDLKNRETIADLSIYQIMWSIYLGNKKAFIDENINKIRSDLDILIPSFDEISEVSVDDAKNRILKMNQVFSLDFQGATNSILKLSAPQNETYKASNSEDSRSIKEDEFNFSNQDDPSEFIKKNTKQLNIMADDALINSVEVFENDNQIESKNYYRVFDIVFISIISLFSGILLALIYINYKNINKKNDFEYDFEEAQDKKNNDSDFASGLSIENDELQQKFDLAIIYYEMKDYEKSKEILNFIINEKNSDNIKILEDAKVLIKKIEEN